MRTWKIDKRRSGRRVRACGRRARPRSRRSQMKPGHDRVPPHREPSPYMSAAEIQTGLNTLDPEARGVEDRRIDSVRGRKAPGVVRRRVSGPQYAITHTRTLEYMIVTKGTGTLVTGGTLIPPTIDSDPYPNTDPNATIRSAVGVTGGLARKVGPGDVDRQPARHAALAEPDRRRRSSTSRLPFRTSTLRQASSGLKWPALRSNRSCRADVAARRERVGESEGRSPSVKTIEACSGPEPPTGCSSLALVVACPDPYRGTRCRAGAGRRRCRPAGRTPVGSGPTDGVHDRRPRLDVQLAERVAELVDPQQPPPVVILVEAMVEKHRAARPPTRRHSPPIGRSRLSAQRSWMPL